MRFSKFRKFLLSCVLAGLVSGCCGNVDVSGLPCYKELFEEDKNTLQKQEYQLEQKRAPRFNR